MDRIRNTNFCKNPMRVKRSLSGINNILKNYYETNKILQKDIRIIYEYMIDRGINEVEIYKILYNMSITIYNKEEMISNDIKILLSYKKRTMEWFKENIIQPRFNNINEVN